MGMDVGAPASRHVGAAWHGEYPRARLLADRTPNLTRRPHSRQICRERTAGDGNLWCCAACSAGLDEPVTGAHVAGSSKCVSQCIVTLPVPFVQQR
jgi:hypothetical protein